MGHELKHHLVDRDLPIACCSDRNANEHIEISAEIFAAELIYPEQDFAGYLSKKGIVSSACTADDIVHLKRDTQKTLSYAGLAKRAVFLGFATSGSLDRIQWEKLEEKIYGKPFYKKLRR